ncbi:Mitochondrial intermediate peptidase [Penicillium atrosanguineum]|uniref:Mitochondrial intermediate peptidase n=1 Tax=Penicillium atrosanguineum TaxID=1132637 RepID=UPI002399F715|nr:Mitochondrial intermediate peptidase [Penicillium atrosanguineum]KAJ5293081.1 Mitochondrial intermediate peptidase [Penicillium atrosanguineum]
MHMLAECERILGDGLLRLPAQHNYRYSPTAEKDLLELLFRSLVGHNEELIDHLFPEGVPNGPWKLAEAHGAREGAEYSEAARGKRCGHIFRAGEATYRCVTCAADDTCVLCSRCFDASDHTGHQYQISLSSGNCGCCDCGDEEAWRLPLFCAIHTDSGHEKEKEREQRQLPPELVSTIRLTISRVLDYFCDVISCSPEQLRLGKTIEGIKADEEASRLRSGWYGEGDLEEEEPEFAVMLWNDEKHTIRDVAHQVTRACRERDSFGVARAHETNDIGRSVIRYSKDLQRLLAVSKIIEEIKVTVTVRSARDTFREQMCGTLVEWLADIAGCSILGDNEIFRQIICEEMLSPWRKGSGAYNAEIGVKGIDDQQILDNHLPGRTVMLTLPPHGQILLATEDDVEDDDAGEGNEQDEDDDYVEAHDDADDEDDEMELELARLQAEADGDDDDMDMDMGAEDELALAERILANLTRPPRPSPPPAEPREQTPQPEQSGANDSAPPSYVSIPRTPHAVVKPPPARTEGHWEVRPPMPAPGEKVAPYEDLWQRTRLDWLVLFDLRLWKKTRTDLRDLYISTVVNVPQFKRIMGLRLSALYTALAQLYLIADREPDHSIVNLSLQLLTTPSITEEIVYRGNFLTKVMSILYTFLTTRQVGEPQAVNPNATLAFDSGSVTNRRLYHFFLDLRYLLQSEFVQHRVRTEEQYLPQFLDLVKLSQGICPNVRAVGEHVEYETDAWISASILMREINRLCRQFCEAFSNPELDNGHNLLRAIKTTTLTAIIHSTGVERKRFEQAEIKEEIRFKTLPPFDFEIGRSGQIPCHRVVEFVVEKGSISFHHALHYTLSWLIECGRSVNSEVMRGVLFEAAQNARDELHAAKAADKPVDENLLTLGPEDLLLTMFDYPLRVCAWLAQMKAGMWVRNGLSLRHQMSQYRGVSSRDFAYYRDIFLLQTALVTCDPSRVLASIAHRFGMVDWMSRNYMPRSGYEDSQIVDVAEEFVHLLVILLTDRTSLTAIDDSTHLTKENISRDIAHVLCFKPLSFSDLSTRLSDKLLEADEFQDVLEEVANFRPPEGLSDSGTFELKPENLDLVDPYSAHYTKNQRDEAESIYREWMAKKTGKKPSDIVYEPKLRPISSGVFSDLPRFTSTMIFAQIVHQCLEYVISCQECTPTIPPTRVETFLQVILHLILAAVLEDNFQDGDMETEQSQSFNLHALSKSREIKSGKLTIVGLLERISVMNEFSSCGPKIRHILKRLWQKCPRTYTSATATLKFPFDRIDTSSPAIDLDGEKETKKKQAMERQARVMAQFQQQQQQFLNSQGDIDWGDEDFSDLESETEATPETKMWKYPSGTCILCQEETNDSRLYGTFALMQDSTILRQTDIRDPDRIREVLRTPTSLDRSAEDIRPFGVAGENRTTIRRLDSSGSEVISEKVGLSKGFNPKNTLRGPVTTGCGHIMHYSCFEVYYGATQRRHTQQIARNHPENTLLKEFVCPLCKALGNAFLPITWKGKEESYPGALNTSSSFDDWMSAGLKQSLNQSQNFPVLMIEKDKAFQQPYSELFVDYLSKTLVPPLASKVSQLVNSSGPSGAAPSHFISSSSRIAMPGLFPGDDIAPSSPLQQVSSPSDSPMTELLQIYRRLKKTIKMNHIQSLFNNPPETMNNDDLVHTDSLIRSFGFSIAAVEIAQRGVESEQGSTLLDKIPPLTLTHLRVLSETALTYAAVGCVHSSGIGKSLPTHEFQDMHRQKICQLFVGHPCLSGTALLNDVRNIEPLLAMDTFVFLAECSLSLLPVLHIDMRHLIQMCYVAEIVKTAVTFVLWPLGLKEELTQQGEADLAGSEVSGERYNITRHFFDSIVAELKANSVGRAEGSSFPAESGYVKDGEESATPVVIMALHRLISSYALTFLRKAVILLHVQHGVDFPNSGFADAGASELDRLTKVLQLPSIDEVFMTINPARNTNSPFDAVVSGWIFHWNASRSGIRFEDHRLWPSLPHPAIFELVGLPKNFDSLIEEANRRRCPNSKKELSDPSICLFCGDIFCSQAVCCMHNKLGGCNQHLQKCGKNIGLFINIRKCTVLYLHNHNGSWHWAPYLDRHGEVDPGLRRNRQLILNQKRYDRLLRDVWLSHAVPATISRKLEAEINNGGWETI